MTTTPTPALRSAIADELRAQRNRVLDIEADADLFLARITPFLAPAPVEQAALLEAFIARAEQACRYALKRQDFTDTDKNYRGGFTDGTQVCEITIRPHITRHFQSLATEKGGEDSAKWAEFGERILRGVKEASASGMMSEEDETTLECAMQCGVGNVQRVPYDPAIHGNDIEDAEPGDPIWWWGAARASTGKGQT